MEDTMSVNSGYRDNNSQQYPAIHTHYTEEKNESFRGGDRGQFVSQDDFDNEVFQNVHSTGHVLDQEIGSHRVNGGTRESRGRNIQARRKSGRRHNFSKLNVISWVLIIGAIGLFTHEPTRNKILGALNIQKDEPKAVTATAWPSAAPTNTNQPSLEPILSISYWGAYPHDYHQHFEYSASRDGIRGAISGVQSLTSTRNQRQTFIDRKFRFKTSVPIVPGELTKEEEIGDQSDYFAKRPQLECPHDTAITFISSTPQEYQMDTGPMMARSFTYKCGTFDGLELDNCGWSDYVNNINHDFVFECPNHKVITGVRGDTVTSETPSGVFDRRYKFKCCSFTL